MRRPAWGSASPTKPMDPLTATSAPVSSATAVRSTHRVRPTSMPRAEAAVSPNAKASSVRPDSASAVPRTAVAPSAIATADQRAPASDPMSHARISR